MSPTTRERGPTRAALSPRANDKNGGENPLSASDPRGRPARVADFAETPLKRRLPLPASPGGFFTAALA